ncbi:probable peptidyl-tRNA hydrolase isoform X1 [Calypte anna]|uniref:probable peptidyl-tRNA hydrolase isoform X1 n=1 Tax=Calypte anna TaxID=9244 RepID=UPI0011C452A3|nr:probable peptidyl-tRNA hydrolase isoform X1 [Calypte anna]
MVEDPGPSWQPCRALLTPGGQVAGLGNYGLRGTRHSVGMAVLDRLARQLAVAEGWRADKRCCADVTMATAQGLELLLLKPRRLMNLNGLSVASAAEIYNLHPEDIYLVHDDLDKALGKVAIKKGGSARGHNGVRSCISALHSDEMTRLRVGIGRPEGDVTVSSYVLAPFSTEEQERLEQVLAQAVTFLLDHILQRRAPVGELGDRG